MSIIWLMNLSPLTIEFLLAHQWPMVLAVSGWPDSMCMMTLIRDLWLEQWRGLTDLHVAHYHHGQRSQSDDEVAFVQEQCAGMSVHVWYYVWDSSTERDLRVARHGFFQSVMEEVWATVLVTGHNLTDRIETSLMNMRRGCMVKGFVNMKSMELRSHGAKEPWTTLPQVTAPQRHSVTILRPLLYYSKQEIHNYCDQGWIVYVTDESNADVTVSQRNQIRHDIVMKLSEQELWGRRDLYRRLEESQASYDHPVRDDEMQAWNVGAVGEWSLEYLAWLFDWSDCYGDMTQGRLLEWQRWIGSSFAGEKFVWWWRWWIKTKKVWLAPLGD